LNDKGKYDIIIVAIFGMISMLAQGNMTITANNFKEVRKMAKIMKMGELICNSVRVIPGTRAFYPQYGEEETIEIMDLVPKFPGCYATNNSTVAYIYEGAFYVTPYTRSVMATLNNQGFKERCFYVPFSNWDYPVREKARWEVLREAARKSYDEDFMEDCISYCDEHGIGAIPEDILANCFEMPYSGVPVKHPYFERRDYPVISSLCFDCTVPDRIARYNTNNGRVVFVYRNGHTYIAKGYSILAYLREAGFKRADYYVPLSNGEKITDPDLMSRWESVTKF